EQRFARALVDRIERTDPTPDEEAAIIAQIGEEIRATWQTEEHLAHKEVADEVEHVVFYLRRVIYRVLPRLHESLEAAITSRYGPAARAAADRPFLRFGSWVGGDMDGNPAVGPETIIATLERQRELILDCYVTEVRALAERCTQSPTRARIAPETQERTSALEALLPDVAASLGDRFRDMPYRRLLHLITARLHATRRDGPGSYPGP
ncbi:MAG: phosphoenolpyruvate carboxylase, partial [Planctomycetota bacterium]|nr:phosphoenolpyruvate carboxylase [Planctomycetota bacterium]